MLAGGVCMLALSSMSSAATSIQVSSLGKIEIVGSTSAVPDGGTASNFSTTTLVLGTTFASFQMVLANGSNTRVADLRVTPVAVTGTLDTAGGTQSGLMVAQTSNSQGLTDTGTFSILTDFAGPNLSGVSSMTFRLDWFQPDTTIPLPISVEITSFDYDFNQFLRVSTGDYSNQTHGSALTASTAAGFTRWQAGNSDSSFSNPDNAVIFNTNMDSSMFIEVGKNGSGNSLFMFEFRDPSINLVPEPSSAFLVLSGLAVFGLRRRRA